VSVFPGYLYERCATSYIIFSMTTGLCRVTARRQLLTEVKFPCAIFGLNLNLAKFSTRARNFLCGGGCESHTTILRPTPQTRSVCAAVAYESKLIRVTNVGILLSAQQMANCAFNNGLEIVGGCFAVHSGALSALAIRDGCLQIRIIQ
jgi:hypothetical protein